MEGHSHWSRPDGLDLTSDSSMTMSILGIWGKKKCLTLFFIVMCKDRKSVYNLGRYSSKNMILFRRAEFYKTSLLHFHKAAYFYF